MNTENGLRAGQLAICSIALWFTTFALAFTISYGIRALNHDSEPSARSTFSEVVRFDLVRFLADFRAINT